MIAHEKKGHDYHLVEPSVWPLLSSVAALILAFGAVLFFHTKSFWLMTVGFALTLYSMFMWFRDVISEGEYKGDHTPVVQLGLRYGMTLFIMSEVMFFVAWFWAFFGASIHPLEILGSIWPPKGIKAVDPWDVPLINTLILS